MQAFFNILLVIAEALADYAVIYYICTTLMTVFALGFGMQVLVGIVTFFFYVFFIGPLVGIAFTMLRKLVGVPRVVRAKTTTQQELDAINARTEEMFARMREQQEAAMRKAGAF